MKQTNRVMTVKNMCNGNNIAVSKKHFKLLMSDPKKLPVPADYWSRETPPFPVFMVLG